MHITLSDLVLAVGKLDADLLEGVEATINKDQCASKPIGQCMAKQSSNWRKQQGKQNRKKNSGQ